LLAGGGITTMAVIRLCGLSQGAHLLFFSSRNKLQKERWNSKDFK
jgi:hypothetical protein